MLTKSAISSSNKVTKLLLRSTLIATAILGVLLIIHDVANDTWMSPRIWILLIFSIYLFISEVLFQKGKQHLVSWMLIICYVAMAFLTLLFWGLNAPIGILTIGFVAILPSILMGARFIIPVVVGLIVVLLVAHLLHQQVTSIPTIRLIPIPSTYWDVLIYSTILIIFSMTAWAAGTQREKSLKRALDAEAALKKQKKVLSVELEKESAALRLSQLSQIRQLYKFALIGQSTAATLHDLSNHLSILNFDIDDLQQNDNSQAVTNAKENIEQINKMVRQARQQLDSYDRQESFNAIRVIIRSVKDLDYKFHQQNIKLTRLPIDGKGSFLTTGNPIALMQIVTILLNNALDACSSASHPEIIIEIKNTTSKLHVSIKDNGPGIHPDIRQFLFNPVKSTKTTGLGVGLFIAQNLAREQFNGIITTRPSKRGAHFTVSLPQQTALGTLPVSTK